VENSRPGKTVVLFVCYANRERSTLAQFLLRDRLEREFPDVAARMEIDSAGAMLDTYLKWAEDQGKPFALPYFGKPLGRHVARRLAGKNIDTTSYRSKEITPSLAQRADLILTMDLPLKRELRSRWPELEARITTFKEFIFGENTPEPDIGEFKQVPNTDAAGDWYMDDDYARRFIRDVESAVEQSLPHFVEFVRAKDRPSPDRTRHTER
jgi:protein-tyrosine-phosphatase